MNTDIKHSNEVKTEFIRLLGEDKVNQLGEDNWIGFDTAMEFVDGKLAKTETIEIDFYHKDIKGDKCVYSTICYDRGSKKWWCQNYDEYDDDNFDDFSDLQKSLENREEELSLDGDPVITF